jgi:hypothetical protein
MRQGGGLQQCQPICVLKLPELSEQTLVVLMRSAGPGIGLVNKAHSLQHEKTEVGSRPLKLTTNLGSDRACLTDERGGDSGSRVC